MLSQKFSIIILLTIITMTVTAGVITYATLYGRRTFPNTGELNSIGVGVYHDATCETPVSNITWGYVSPGSTQNRTIYIKNEGNTRMILNMTTGNWSPDLASTSILLSWNQEGTQVDAQSNPLETVLTLSVSANITGISTFSFNVNITGTEY
jgi:hypothetical protein